MSATAAAPSMGITSTRVTAAITAARGAEGSPAAAGRAEDTSAPQARPGGGCAHAAAPAPVRDASRGATAGPDAAFGGGGTADGQRNVMSVAPDALEDGTEPEYAGTPSTPERASADAYAARATANVPAPATIAAAGAWDAEWEQRFAELQLAPADMEALRSSGLDAAALGQIARELGSVEVLTTGGAPAPQAGIDAGSVASADGPTAADVATDVGQAPTSATSAWDETWERKFRDVMTRMGMSATEVDAQLAGVQGQPISQAQLEEALRGMETSVGAFDAGWKERFGALLDELRTPAAEKDAVLQQLAGTGMSEAQLAEAYRQMEANRPGWNAQWQDRFRALDVPPEMIAQLKDAGAPASVLQRQYDTLLETKLAYSRDGRLERLQDAKATAAEKWDIMLAGMSGKEFDKRVEQVRSSHVSGWKRAGSVALNLVPGVFAVQYLTGKDWVTGEKIDRTNPLNIIGAVASGFAGFTAVRSAIAGVQGLSAANAAARATISMGNGGRTAAIGLAESTKLLGSASPLSTGSLQAIEAAGLVTKFEKGLRFTDYLKSSVPLINRFGEAGRLSAVGRGYTQGMQLAAGMAATRAVEGGGVVVDKAVKAGVLGELKQGTSLQQAMASVGRTSGTSGGYAMRAQDVLRDGTRYGFLQGSVGKAVDGARVGRGSGAWTMNPFRNTNTISSTGAENVFSLGKSVNFGSTGGLAQGLGTIKAANVMSNPGSAAQALVRAQAANDLIRNPAVTGRLTGVTMTNDVQRIETLTRTAEWARKLGVADGSRFRTLMQLDSSGRMASRVSNMVQHGGSQGYRATVHASDVARRLAGFTLPPLVATAAVGLGGRQMQVPWDYVKERDSIRAKEADQARLAEREQADMARLYAEQQAAGGRAADGAQPGAAPTPAAPDTTGTVPATGDGVYVDPATGRYVDPATGLQADPATGNVYDPRSGQVVGNLNAA